MKCKNCGDELQLANGNAVCQSCGTCYALDIFYEDVDAHICYIENDANGRRTKDSILAQEVYRQLEARRINTFYERISACDATGDDLEKMRLGSIYQAKVILVVGTSADHFRVILERFGQHFSGKTVIPVCAEVNPIAIPRELSKIQALDCGSIGWEKDLESGILRILGREKEIDLLDTHQKTQKNRAVVIGVATAVLLGAVGVALFWAINENRQPGKTEQVGTVTTMPLTNQQIYERAQAWANEGKYLEAIDAYSQIPEFKDSTNQIKSIFNFYDGYYLDEAQETSLYINIVDGATAEFTVDKVVDGKLVRIEEAILLEDNQINGVYVDNLRNEGDISITLFNDKVELDISTKKTEGEVSAGNVFIEFSLEKKEDRPPIKEVTREILLDWVAHPTSVDDIRAAGYELEYVFSEMEPDYRYGTQYTITNSVILVITSDEDLPKCNGGYDVPKRDEAIVVAIIGPVKLLCPEKIGKSSCVFQEADKMYVPYAYNITWPMAMDGKLVFDVNEYNMTNAEFAKLPSLTIEENSTVGIVSKDIVGETEFANLWEIHKQIYDRTA